MPKTKILVNIPRAGQDEEGQCMERFNYQQLAEHFENSLLTTLRAHSAASELFEMWVPDPDIVQSIINMVDNFDFETHKGFVLEVAEDALSSEQQQELISLTSQVASVSIVTQDKILECTFQEEEL